MSAEKVSSDVSFIKTYKAELLLFLITLSWGLTFPISKISLDFISPVFFNFFRFFITLVLFYFFFRKKLKAIRFIELKGGIILGVFLFAGFCLQTVGMKFTTASKSAFITGSSMVIIPFAQYFILKTNPKSENIFGGILVLIGLGILTESHLSYPNIGDILTFLCAIAFAVHVVLLNKYSDPGNFYVLAFGQFLTMVAMSLLFMLLFEIIIYENFFIKYNSTLVFTLIYGSVFATLISILVMTKYQRMTTPVRAGIIYSMESVFAAGFAYLLLNETLNTNQLIGIIIMIIGLCISEFYSYIKFKFTLESKR